MAIPKGNINNYSAYEKRRVDLDLSIGYEHHIGKARDLLTQMMASHPPVLPELSPSVDVLELGDTQVRLSLRSWTTWKNYFQVRRDLLEEIKQQQDIAGTGGA